MSIICPTRMRFEQMEEITESRIRASRRSGIEIAVQHPGIEAEEEQRQRSKTEENIKGLGKKVNELKENLITTTSSVNISTPRIDEEDIIRKLKQATINLKDILISGAEVAKKKIERGKNIAEEKIKEQQEGSRRKKSRK